MRTLKFIFSLILFVIVHQTTKSQSIQYGYDAAGNRTSRTIVALKSNEVNLSDTLVDENMQINNDMLVDVEQVMVFPNPASDQLHVVLHAAELLSAEYRLYSTKGVLLDSGQLRAGDNTFPVAHHSPGLYLLLVSSNGTTEQWKIIIK